MPWLATSSEMPSTEPEAACKYCPLPCGGRGVGGEGAERPTLAPPHPNPSPHRGEGLRETESPNRQGHKAEMDAKPSARSRPETDRCQPYPHENPPMFVQLTKEFLGRKAGERIDVSDADGQQL